MVIKCLRATKPPPQRKKILFFSIKEISLFYWVLSSPIDEKVLITNCLILEPQLFYTPMANYKCKISFSKLHVKTNICKFTNTCHKIFSQIESEDVFTICIWTYAWDVWKWSFIDNIDRELKISNHSSLNNQH